MAFWRVSFALLLALGEIRADCTRDCGCPPLWTSYRGNCYRLFGQAKSWFEAEGHCKEFFTRLGQGHLASVHSEGEDNFIFSFWTSTFPSRTKLWIGATDEVQEGVFIWTDGTEFDYQSWLPWQPDNQNAEGEPEDYLCYAGDAWNDSEASRNWSYICKMPGGE